MSDNEIIFYDIEVFERDSLVVFIDSDCNIIDKVWSNPDRVGVAKGWVEMESGFERIPDIIKGKTLCGYNNYHYDDYILTCMLNPYTNTAENIKKVNDRIIAGKQLDFSVNPDLKTIDAYQQISVARPGLKTVEGNMGKSIIESVIDFDHVGFLNEDEKREVEEYCVYDVLSTIAVYKLRIKSYFESKDYLVTMLPNSIREKAGRYNTTTISAMILTEDADIVEWKTNDANPSDWRGKTGIPDQVAETWEKLWRKVDGIPDAVWETWEESMTETHNKRKGVSRTVNAFDCKVVFGMGGLHAAPKSFGYYENVRLADVGSMYPSIINGLHILGDATGLYDSMRLERLSIKHTDPVRANALKLILNSVYGNLKNQYSALYNPLASATVCVYGQIALFRLCTMLADAGYQIINGNTDGVAFVDRPELGDKADKIYKAWEKEFDGLVLEEDRFKKWWQKDVNNYIAITDSGKLKCKGGETNKAFDNRYFDNNSCRIVQMALVDAIVNNGNPMLYIADHIDEPLLFQYILKAGSTYLGTQNKAGEWMQKVNRVFAARDIEGIETTKLYKVRQDGHQVNYPDVPEIMYLWNGDVNDIPNFRGIIDIDHYYNLVKNKLKGWGHVVY